MFSLRKSIAAAVAFSSVLAVAGPAQALSIQSVNAGSFTTTGSAVNTSPISFGGFTAGPSSWLSGVSLRIVSGLFSQNIQLTKTSGSGRIVTPSANPTFKFGTSPQTQSATTAQAFTATPNTITALSTASIIATASGSWTNLFSSLSINTPTLQTYFSGTPSIVSYSTAYNVASCQQLNLNPGTTCTVNPDDDPLEPFMTSTQFTGTLFVDYEYNNPLPTPGPLPILGAGAAFAASRRLRRRIQLNKPIS